MDAITATRPDTQQEIKNFRVLGHDPSAAWGGGIVEVSNGHAYVGAVGTSSYDGPEGLRRMT